MVVKCGTRSGPPLQIAPAARPAALPATGREAGVYATQTDMSKMQRKRLVALLIRETRQTAQVTPVGAGLAVA